MSSLKLNVRRLMCVLHYGNGGKRWDHEGVMALWVNGQAVRITVKDDVTYAMVSVTADSQYTCVETVYVDNWGILRYLSHTGQVTSDSIVSIDLLSKKVIVTEHHLTEASLAVMCKMSSPLTYGELRKVKVTVSGCCTQLGTFDPKLAPEAVKLPNSTFLYAVPQCKCVDKCEYHNMYKFVSNGCHDDPEAFRASTDDMMWEGPSFVNRELPEVIMDTETTRSTFPVLLGTWGSVGNTLIEVPVTKVEDSCRKQCPIRKMNYGELKNHWASNKNTVSRPRPDNNNQAALNNVQENQCRDSVLV